MKSFKNYIKDVPKLLILQGKHSLPLNEWVSKADIWKDKNENFHLGDNVHEQTEKMHKLHPHDEEDLEHLKKYTGNSNGLNKHLFRNEDTTDEVVDRHNLSKLDKATSKPLNASVSTFSGLGYDPTKEFEKAKRVSDGVVKLPAYTSTSLDKHIANSFSQPVGLGPTKTRHFIHFHLEKEDKGAFIGKHSRHPSESELLLPRKTKVKLLHEEEFSDGPLKTKVWHVKIHKE